MPMLEDAMEQELFSLAESNHLRLEAMLLFEQCLTNGDESALIAFIELQLVYEPPRLQLLHNLANDLQQRLLSLREYHFDVRDRVVRTMSESYSVDITPLTPSDMLERYHHLTTDEVLSFVREHGAALSDEDATLLRKMVEASLRMAAQLYNDIQLTARLHNLVLDWWEGLNAITARQCWNAHNHTQHKNIRH
jgi:hypothetical protein